MTRLTHAALALMAIAAVAAVRPAITPATPAPMHLRLVKSEPGKDSTVATPSALRLWFSEEPQTKLSAVTLMTADSAKVATGDLVANGADAKLLEVPVTAKLAPGSYVVSWRTASADGHPVRGSFGFKVR